MSEYIDTPLFGVGLSIIAYTLSSFIYKRTKIIILNPLLVGIALVVGILTFFNIDYQMYEPGGEMIIFFLGPATVALAVPLYKRWQILRENFVPIIIGIVLGSTAGIGSILLLGKIMKLDNLMISSLLPKSTTSPIAIEISGLLGGNQSLTVSFVIITGIIGYIFAERILKLFRVTDPVAKGIAIGTTSHAVGTAKAMELGEVEGAMSSLAISVTGIVTVLMVPGVIWLLNII
jgi:predicted murein hydrolase (TIGR00659 family)